MVLDDGGEYAGGGALSIGFGRRVGAAILKGFEFDIEREDDAKLGNDGDDEALEDDFFDRSFLSDIFWLLRCEPEV